MIRVWNANTAQPGISPVAPYYKFDYWVKNASTDATRRRGGSVGGSSRLGEDQRVISTEVDKPFILC